MSELRVPFPSTFLKNAMRYGPWCALLVLALGGPAHSEAYEQDVLSKAFESRIREVMERHVPAREFSVLVTATPNGRKLPTAPYVPKGATGGAVNTLPLEELDAYVGKLRVEVLLSKRLNKARRKIEELISKNVKLRPNRGDRVLFSELGIEITSDEWERERNTLRQEITIAKAEADRLNRELQTAILAKEASREPNQNPDATPKDQGWNSPYIPYGLGGLGLLALLVMLWFSRSLSKAGESLSSAIGTIGDAMVSANNTTSVVMEEGRGGGGVQSLEAKTTIENKGGGNLPVESLYSHLAKMHETIMEGYNDASESVIVRHLNNLLRSSTSASKGMALFEFLGPELAQKLFSRIGVEAQETMKRFQQEGSYPKPKIEMMMEAAEELRTRLMMESFNRVNGKPSDRVAEGLAQLGDDDIVQLMSEMKPDLLPRLFLYFNSTKIAFLLDRLKRISGDKFSNAVRLLPRMPEMMKVGEMDNEIAEALKAILARTSADAERPFLKVYKEIVEQSPTDVRDEIVKTLSTNARIKTYFQENIITISTLFTLPEALQVEILEALSNKEFAALAAGSTVDAERKEVIRMMPARRKELILEEQETIEARNANAVASAYAKSRDIVVSKIRTMKAEGRLPKEKVAAKPADAKKKVA